MLQVGAEFLLSAGYCWLVGSLLARVWLVSSDVVGTTPASRWRRYDLQATGLAIVGNTLALLAGAAAMSGLPLSDAYQTLLPMLGTDFGRTGAFVSLTLIAYGVLRWLAKAQSWWPMELCLLTLLTLTRAFAGHAGEAGLFSAVHLSESLHLAAVGIWTGIVLVSAGPVLQHDGEMAVAGAASGGFLARMSDGASVAVLIIIGTGIYNSWHRIGSVDALLPAGGYVVALATKVALVMLALLLGAYNKVVGLPLSAREIAGLAVVRTVLRVEAIVLLLALLVASLLTVLAPPGAL